jgi:hypothetical protein
MHRSIALVVLATLFAACDQANDPVAPSAVPSEEISRAGVLAGRDGHYGRATAVDASVLGAASKFCDSGALPKSGGSVSGSGPSATIPGVLTAGAMTCRSTGGNKQVTSDASLATLALTVGGQIIAAGSVASTATVRCTNATTYTTSGSSNITALVVNGQPVVVTGVPNQGVNLPNGRVVINEQTVTGTKWHRKITVTAVRVVITGASDVAIAKSFAGLDCA